ncbi:hypothetical protein P280DRAFT_490114 [Massarina eburnea CBS 473.64]|uniref:Uncharacterized protein n=1 Tax=Massarina eburnea CBS 473.64 TaxID=1395130 RepID=A0A6A6RZM4_9PLEO|nr:hypothetical protein P280DRAFT_490114 [Massarina eburnea CBS 473.64]
MFATIGTKSVGRDELQSPESSPRSSPDPAFEELLRSRTLDQYDFTKIDSPDDDAREEPPMSEDEAELVLFAAPANTTQSHKIRLSSPDAATGEPGLLVKKPRSYYFADDSTGEKLEEYSAVALTGEEVTEISKLRWPGCAVPWKVQTVTASGMKKIVLVGHPPTLVTVEEKDHKRRRKGKKSRIALRKKVQTAHEKNDERTRLAKEKEEAEREKRTRRNREKKVKRKAREKTKKPGEADAEDPSIHPERQRLIR